MSEVTLVCPECGSDDIHVVISWEGEIAFAEDSFDDRDPAMCGSCHHKDEAHDFIKQESY